MIDTKKRHIKMTHDMVKAILLMTTKEDSRYALNAIALRKDGYVYATEGHIMGRVHVLQEDEDSLPVGLIPEESLTLEDAFLEKTETTEADGKKGVKVEESEYILIGREELEQALKVKPGRLFPIEGIYVTWAKFGKPTITATRGIPEKVRFETERWIQGKFPNVRMVWQNHVVGKMPSLVLGAAAAQALVRAAQLADPKNEDAPVALYIHDEESQLGFFSWGSGFEVQGAIMPLSKSNRPYPAFE